MPYITQDRRDALDIVAASAPRNAGELNYLITRLFMMYLRENGTSYQVFNDILGACEGAKLELYRRRVADYEDAKITQNGDVY
jgi:hypothetical protein